MASTTKKALTPSTKKKKLAELQAKVCQLNFIE
jgi:hypothetical protein